MPDGGPGNRKVFGKYKLIAQLATGGMAEIFLAAHSSLAGFEKLVVIKRILPNLAKEKRFVNMFLDEAKIAAMLNHPNVVQIFDLGRIAGQYFIAMEYLAGESLGMVLRKCRADKISLPPPLAAGVLLQAAEGLHHAHTVKGNDGKILQIVHRDVSPQNIFVLYDGGVKLVDFGIAKAVMSNTKTNPGTLKGKYAYMSPEQIHGQGLDGRSDVFALGIVLWESLAGRKLFKQENDLKLLQAITQEDAPSPKIHNPEVPTELEAICKKALCRDRDNRFQSAAELRSALAGYLKSSASEGDTVAIGAFMQSLFPARIQEKRRLIEVALSETAAIEENLFEDLNHYLAGSSADASLPPLTRTIPSGFLAQKSAASHRRRWLIGLVLAAVLVAGLVAAINLFPGAAVTPPAPDGGRGLASRVAAGDGGTVAAAAGDAAGVEPSVLAAGLDAGVAAGSAELEPALPPTREPPGKPKRKPPVKIARKPEPPPAPEPVVNLPPGLLRLTTNPWAEIFYKGKRLGETPLIDIELPAGKIKLRAVNPDEKIDRTITIEIKPGEKVTRTISLY